MQKNWTLLALGLASTIGVVCTAIASGEVVAVVSTIALLLAYGLLRRSIALKTGPRAVLTSDLCFAGEFLIGGIALLFIHPIDGLIVVAAGAAFLVAAL